jgi:FtsP/CotA-like multicopper oxidase with cupredoxin domain
VKSPSPLSRRRVLGGSLVTGMATLLTASARSQAGPPAADLRLLTVRESGFDGTVPGPALQIRRGEEVRLRVVNQMAEPTAVHWHGVRLVNAMDGTPPLTQAPIAPGQDFDCRFVAPDAGTYWYHPAGQTPGGLYGALVVSETENIDVDRDLTLIFATPKQPAASGEPPITVNGAANLEIRTQANARLRLRVINASAGDMLGLRIKGLPAFVMAIDGQPAEPFAARDGRLSLGPGNRIDAFVDCTQAPGATAPILVERKTGDVAIVSIVCGQGAAKALRQDPKPLPANPLPERMDFAGALRFDWATGRISKTQPSSPLFTVKRGRTVMLGLSNPTSENSHIHLHGHSFRLLDALDDGWKPFWLDTMPIEPRSKSRIAFVADNPGKWAIEGLALDQELWFEVT